MAKGTGVVVGNSVATVVVVQFSAVQLTISIVLVIPSVVVEISMVVVPAEVDVDVVD